MNEAVLAKCESRTNIKSVQPRRVQRNKFTFQLRCCIYIGVILIFYTAFLLTATGDTQKEQLTGEKATTHAHHKQRRQPRSLVSSSAIDFENFAENENHFTRNYNVYTEHDVPEMEVEQTQPQQQPKPQPQSQPQQDKNDTNLASANCTPPAILEFPADGFTRAQRQHGWILIHILLAMYCFWLLAVICDDYFLPAIEQICLTLNVQTDVVGATFMAAATSSPELFMNCVGTFITKGDIGVGTIVGSSVFNILAVPACCGLFIGQCVRLDWWPVTRDCLMYCVAVVALICTLYDGKVMWYESLILFIAYFFYMAVMYNNDKMARSARQLISKYRRKLHLVRSYRRVSELTPLIARITQRSNTSLINCNSSNVSMSSNINGRATNEHATTSTAAQMQPCMSDFAKLESAVTFDTVTLNTESSAEIVDEYSDYADTPWQRNNRSLLEYVVRWPITFLLYITIPDSRKRPSVKYVTFLLAICWIGMVSYLVAYAITIIGDTLSIPDSVMGLTILSAGMSVPEAVSSIIVTKQGHGAMGISNAIGSNTFDILLCLSVPWFVKAYFLPNNANELWVAPNSSGLTYSVVFLLTTLLGLYIALAANRFTLNRRIGVVCMIMYVIFIIIASLIELNVFFAVNLPVCEH